MRDLNEATEKICDLFGSLIAMKCVIAALAATLPRQQRAAALRMFQEEAEIARVTLGNSALVGEGVLAALERELPLYEKKLHGA